MVLERDEREAGSHPFPFVSHLLEVVELPTVSAWSSRSNPQQVSSSFEPSLPLAAQLIPLLPAPRQLSVDTTMASTAAASTYASNNAQADFEDFGHEHDTFDPLLGRDLSTLHQEPVFPLIQRVRSEVVEVIDTTLSYDQLRQNPTLNFSIVRPLSLKLSRGERPPSGLIYALLVCRVHFLDVASDDLAFA